MIIHFVCPKCGKADIEEVMSNVTVASEVGNMADIADNGQVALVYFEQTNEGGEVDRYQCETCGFLIATTNAGLMAYLCKHGMVELEASEELDPGQEVVKVEHCGQCEHFHRVEYRGDCRNDAERFTDAAEAGHRLCKPVKDVTDLH